MCEKYVTIALSELRMNVLAVAVMITNNNIYIRL